MIDTVPRVRGGHWPAGTASVAQASASTSSAGRAGVAMPPRHRSRSRSAPAEQGRRPRAAPPPGQSLADAGFPAEARAAAEADQAAFRGVQLQRGRARA
eukprot:15011618-Alexandrium_andersonii.AAC.1